MPKIILENFAFRFFQYFTYNATKNLHFFGIEKLSEKSF